MEIFTVRRKTFDNPEPVVAQFGEKYEGFKIQSAIHIENYG